MCHFRRGVPKGAWWRDSYFIAAVVKRSVTSTGTQAAPTRNGSKQTSATSSG
eukprot:m.906991 g.906991  ORF g.906991 m.906991 type:complete len:52 (-) comp23710_c0_seq2:1139-1294(-)